jgi:hypothetical protein
VEVLVSLDKSVCLMRARMLNTEGVSGEREENEIRDGLW